MPEAAAISTPRPEQIHEILDRAVGRERLSARDAITLIECPDSHLNIMLSAAAEMRDRAQSITRGFDQTNRPSASRPDGSVKNATMVKRA